MEYLPLVLDVKQKPCLVVGGGSIALRKATLLAKAGAKLHIVAPEIDERLVDLVNSTGGSIYQQAYSSEFIDSCSLVIAATDNELVNAQVSKDAQQKLVWVNVVDAPQYCNVIFPAIIDRDPLLIAVSSSGSAPVLARSVRSKIESTFPANLGVLADFIAERRTAVRNELSEQSLRLFWEDFVESEIAECVMTGRVEEAQRLFEISLQKAVGDKQTKGEVYLVGAGPGDPDLLTFKALRLMQRADVILYDRLVAPEIVDLCRRDAERVYVGKARSNHAVPQQTINQLLIDYAKKGQKVVRLKGGDPFIFGRGGEEIAGLTEHNIPFQIVPGISAANGCACYSGIPLTHRDHAQSVRFMTGHLKGDGDGNTLDLPWGELVNTAQTLVIYMGLTTLPIICAELVAHGANEDTLVALIERGTTPNQRIHKATLETIQKEIEDKDIHAPTLMIIGSVVSLHDELKWR